MNNKEIIFVAFGSLGDINPLLAVAQKMKDKHPLVFLANEYFRSHIEKSGVPFHAVGEIEEQLSAKESKTSTGETAEGCISRFENIIGKNFERTYKIIENKIKMGKKLIVISHGNLSPAVPACEKFGIPLILTHYAPGHIPNNREDAIMGMALSGKNEWLLRNITFPVRDFFAQLHFDIKPTYNKYRAQFGLPPLRNYFERIWDKVTFKTVKYNTGLYVPLEIALLPRWFSEPLDKSLDHIQFAGFPFYIDEDTTNNQIIDDFIQQHGKPIVFTPGSVVEDVDAFCKQIIPICRKLGSPGIFASKHGKDGFDALEQVDDVPLLYLDHADLNHLLPKSRCLIHHGGVGTVAQAIKAGIPQIVRPRMYDQPSNGIRVMMYGLGGSVALQFYDADTVANILMHIESNPKHKEFLDYYSQSVKEEDGVLNGCLFIEEYLNKEFYIDEKVA